MEPQKKDYLRETVVEVSEIVEEIPSDLRTSAFAELLKFVLNPDSESLLLSHDTPAVEGKDTSNADIPEWLSNIFSNKPEPHVVASGSRQEQAAWGIIQLCSEQKHATKENLREVLKTRLGVTPESKSNTNRTLRNLVPRYLTREESDNGYSYLPTRNILDVFQ